jgi:predicted DNA-binding protein
MAKAASTHRLDPEIQDGLSRLSGHLHRSKNQLINEALRLFIRQKNRELELTLETTLDELRAYRKRDPDFKQSIQAFVDSEARLEGGDPAEGSLQRKSQSAVRGKIQSILDAP